MKRTLETAVLVVAMLAFGSYNTVNNKLMLQTVCPSLPDAPGEPISHHLFNKPWMFNMMMFMGESLLLIPHNLRKAGKRTKGGGKALDAPLLSGKSAPFYIFALPASCDVLGTGISAVGMMFIDAATWQMMRGAIIIFSAILSVTFLRRKLRVFHWVGVAITVVGLFFIGTAAVLTTRQPARGAEGLGNRAGLGIFLTLLAQLFSAFQFTFEEYLLTGYSVSSLQTVGSEGIWGICYMTVILSVMTYIPGSDHGVYQSLPDGLFMITNSNLMIFLVSTFMVSLSMYVLCGMQVCRKLSAITRCLIDCMRTAVVWGFELLMYYGVSKNYGQPWGRYSYIEFIGFLLLVLGTLVYNGVLKLPAMDYRRRRGSIPNRVLQATWSPTMNRAAAFGHGPNFGPQSPHGPDSPQDSPPPSPTTIVYSPEPTDAHLVPEGEIIIEGMEGLPRLPHNGQAEPAS